ncbi:hypothetical protein HZC34_01550 [Candidatus Saganbacteria bacterium]|nr:hypothetical protein [Candidatus Saganbacteria bacterium]
MAKDKIFYSNFVELKSSNTEVIFDFKMVKSVSGTTVIPDNTVGFQVALHPSVAESVLNGLKNVMEGYKKK